MSDVNDILQEELYPSKKCFHSFTILISLIVGLSSLLMCISQFVGLALQATTNIQYVVHIYGILLSVLAMMTELGWTSIVTDSKILNNWISRGIFYTFIGMIGLMQDEAEPLKKDNESIGGRNVDMMFIYVVAYLMIACGVLYFCMGILCLQVLARKQREEHKENVKEAKLKKKIMKESGESIPPLKTTGENIV
jgi:hypothetical protein